MAAGRLPATHSTTVLSLPGGQASVRVDAYFVASSCQARSVSATDHACAIHPRGSKGRIAIEDLGDRPEPVVTEMMRQWREERSSSLGVTVHLEVRQRERPEEEGPH